MISHPCPFRNPFIRIVSHKGKTDKQFGKVKERTGSIGRKEIENKKD